MNLSAAEMLLTVAALKDSDLTIVVATAAGEAGTIADDEAEPGASMDWYEGCEGSQGYG